MSLSIDHVMMLLVAFIGSGAGVLTTQKVMQNQITTLHETVGELKKSINRAHDRITGNGREISELKGKYNV